MSEIYKPSEEEKITVHQEVYEDQHEIGLLHEALQRFTSGDPSFRLNKLAETLQNTELNIDNSSSVSRTRRENDGGASVTIGTEPYTESHVQRWNMGTQNASEQIMVKTAHELAHAYQVEKGYEKALVDFLNGYNDIPEDKLPYIELYALLSEVGHVNSLSQEQIYKEQSKNTGNLKMETLEDITELISAYVISDEYFTARLDHSVTNLDDETKEQIAKLVIQVCSDLH